MATFNSSRSLTREGLGRLPPWDLQLLLHLALLPRPARLPRCCLANVETRGEVGIAPSRELLRARFLLRLTLSLTTLRRACRPALLASSRALALSKCLLKLLQPVSLRLLFKSHQTSPSGTSLSRWCCPTVGFFSLVSLHFLPLKQ